MSPQQQKQTTEQESTAPASASRDMTDQELDAVSGGIIIIGGMTASPNFAVLATRSFNPF